MNEPTLGNMAQRMDRLERENRRFKWIGVLVLVGIAALMMMGQAKPSEVAKVIEAEQFVLRDKNGKERGFLGVEKGVSGLTLYGKNKMLKATLAASEEGVGLLFSDNNGAGIGLSLEGGEAGLHGFDSNRKMRFALAVSVSGSVIQLIGKDEKPIITLGELNGEAVLGLVSGPEAKPFLSFRARDGSERMTLRLSKGDPMITFTDKYGTKRATMGLVKGTPIVGFWDEQGKPVWAKTGIR